MSIVNKPTIVIAAIACRPYVQAAVAAGFDVIAIDCFADRDTRRLAKKMYQVPLHKKGVDADGFLKIIDDIDVLHVMGLCYGAGFEMQPEVLAIVDQKIGIIGNSADVVDYCKDPKRFFKLCETLNVLHPKVTFKRPKLDSTWLQKTIGGSGGQHIHLKAYDDDSEVGVYYQQKQAGKSIACLFLAHTDQVHMLGIHEQWVDTNALAPYRYGGAATNVQLSTKAKEQLMHYITLITKNIGLVGLNSCDVICDGDSVYLLEINPRLSATIDLYMTAYPDLMKWHTKACDKQPIKSVNTHAVSARSYAHQVIYANAAISISAHFVWPEWVADIPEGASQFDAGMPICSVFAQAESIEKVKSIVQDRVSNINQQLLN